MRLTKQVQGSQKRPIIKARLKLAGRRFNFRFTVADRSQMKYKVLIGQNILKKNFLIDPTRLTIYGKDEFKGTKNDVNDKEIKK